MRSIEISPLAGRGIAESDGTFTIPSGVTACTVTFVVTLSTLNTTSASEVGSSGPMAVLHVVAT